MVEPCHDLKDTGLLCLSTLEMCASRRVKPEDDEYWGIEEAHDPFVLPPTRRGRLLALGAGANVGAVIDLASTNRTAPWPSKG